ncbi:MAG: cardiolipin synthase [Paenibacillaceae bacterium]
MPWIYIALLLLVFQIGAVIIMEHCRPHKAVAWIVIVYLFPPFSFLLYYFMGREYSCLRVIRPEKSMELQQIKIKLIERCKHNIPNELLAQHPGWIENQGILSYPTSFPLTAYNETTVFAEGEPAFQAIFESITEAKHHIHIQFYIIRNDTLGTQLQQLLVQKAQEGVKVRLLYDGVGSYRLPQRYLKQLEDAGVEISCFSPPLTAFIRKNINYRNHRKILIVDGNVGFLGGLNIGDEYLGADPKIGFWRDTHFRIRGDAVLWIQYTFLTDWYLLRGQWLTDSIYYPEQERLGDEFVQIVKSDPDEPILQLIFSCIVSAKKRIYIQSPYFIPDSSIVLALKTAALKGIDVRIIIPASLDSKMVYRATLSYVEELLRCGVRFYSYNNGFIHSKVLIADDLVCSGSANMDIRSLCSHFELNAIFINDIITDRMLEDFNRDLTDSEEILLPDFEKRSKRTRLKEGFARLLSPLF